MENVKTATYKQASFFSILVLAVLTWGFYRSYIVFFPTFEGFQFVQHFHGGIMLLWIALLIVQPLLISRKKHAAHRLMGKLSYVVAPVLAMSIFLVSRMTYHRNLGLPDQTPQDALALMALSVPSIFAFVTVYTLAVVNRKRTEHHMRYMIGTALLMIGPGLGRALIIYFNIPFPVAVSLNDYIVLAIAVTFLVVDVVKKRTYKPFLIISFVLVIVHLLWEGRYGNIWQGFAKIFADTLF